MITLIYQDTLLPELQTWVEQLAKQLDKPFEAKQMQACDIEMMIDQEVQLLFIVCEPKRRTVQAYLDACRDLRIPYTFLPATGFSPIQSVLVPVSFLEEEAEKGQFAAALGRFAGMNTTILQPKDYGTKAERTIRKITALLDKFSLPYVVDKGRKDSFGINKEAAALANQNQQLLLVSASRDYGLDDVLFGPPERKIILRAQVPVMLVNPRGDLYSLCD